MRVTWFNGGIVDGAIALDPRDRGLLLGDGVFETLLVTGGKAQWLDRHFARMGNAAAELGIAFDGGNIGKAATDLARKAKDISVLRITLTRGVAARGLGSDGQSPSLLMSLDAFDPALMFQAASLMTSKIRRNERAPSSRLKTLSYIDGVMAVREVRGRADDALMLNTAGKAASATIANVFLLKGKSLATPSLDQGVLPGIMRGLVLEHAAKLGYAVVEGIIEPEDLLAADVVFLTNSLRVIRPVTHLDGRMLAQNGLEDLIAEMKPRLMERMS
jgi:branched-chain amino acid aminotransferase